MRWKVFDTEALVTEGKYVFTAEEKRHTLTDRAICGGSLDT